LFVFNNLGNLLSLSRDSPWRQQDPFCDSFATDQFRSGQSLALKSFEVDGCGLDSVFDFLDIHFGPANCNGEVLRDTIAYQPVELMQAINQGSASRESTGPQEDSRCGRAATI
jgi:hypothetical protein